MRIVVTGVTGQVGGALVPRLQGFGTPIPIDKTALDFTKLSAIAETLDRTRSGSRYQPGCLHCC